MKRVLLLAGGILAAFSLAASGQANIQSISPPQGPIAGGTTVTLKGSGFAGTTLLLDYAPVTPTSASDTQISFQAPAHDNGIALVELSGNGPNAYAEFLFMPPPLSTLLPGYITTVMGVGLFRGDGQPATSALIESGAAGLTVAGDGSLFLSEPNFNTIRHVRADGIMERYAGTGANNSASPSWGDGGPALQAVLSHPRGIDIDATGNLFLADSIALNSIRRIDAKTGIITTIAGGPTPGFAGDGGPVSKALLNAPLQVAFDKAGNLYFIDGGNARIRRIDTNRIITTIAGNGIFGFSGDGGPATQASFNVPPGDGGAIATDPSGNVYLADILNNRIRKIDVGMGIITTFAQGNFVGGVASDTQGNIFVAPQSVSGNNPRIMKYSASGKLLQTWGSGMGVSPDGVQASNSPFGAIDRLKIDQSGNILFEEIPNNRIRRINVRTGLLDTVAGMGPHIIGEDGPPTATVTSAGDLVFLPSGSMLIAEGSIFRVRNLDANGNLSTFAGNGFLYYGEPDEVPAVQTSTFPDGLAIMPDGSVIVAEQDGGYMRRIDLLGVIHALTAPNGSTFSGDGGPAIYAQLIEPQDSASDVAGNLFIADSNNNRIRRVDAQTGIISTVAGSGPSNGVEGWGKGSYCGDGGPATQACINTPLGIAVDSDGTMYIGENGERVRKVDANGIISTVASGHGSKVRLNTAHNLFVTPLRIEPNGHVYQFAGTNPAQSGIGDGGPASGANFNGGYQGAGIAVDSSGNIFFDDAQNRRIRAIRFGAVISEPGSSVTASAGTPQTGIVGTSFPVALQVTLQSPAATLENGIRVDFASPSSGASCLFPNGSNSYSVLTDINGHGSATCTVNMMLGPYSVTATPLALGQSATFSLTNAENTSATISSSSNPVKAGSPVMLTANVSGVQLADTAPGSVSFYDGATLLGSASLSSGSATFNTSFASAGVHSITARYAGDATHLPSSSAAFSEAVESNASGASTTSISVNGSASNLVFVYFGVVAGRQGANFVINVTGGSNGDQVILLDGNTQLGPVLSLSSGKASYASQLPVGQHKVTAVYLGNSTTAGSASPVVTVERSPRPKPR